jgi:transcriptional repressor NrdR
MRESGTEPTTQKVGLAVLERLSSLDDVAYLRFASVYKGFEGADDFQREVGLLTKTTAPKHPGGEIMGDDNQRERRTTDDSGQKN